MTGKVIVGDKSPLVALLLNLCIFGFVGYFYIGQWQKGIVMVAIWLISLGTLGTVAYIISLIDVFMQARVLQEGGAIEQWTFFNSRSM